MLTLSGLVQSIPAIGFTDESAKLTAHLRRVTGASPADVLLRRQSTRAATSHLLLSSLDAPWWNDADRCMWAMRTLVQSEASALLVLPAKDRSVSDHPGGYSLVASAARRVRLPLLVVRPGPRAEVNVAETVARIVAAEKAKAESRYLEALIDYLRLAAGPAISDPALLLEHTSQVVDGHAAVVLPEGGIAGQGQVSQHIAHGRCAASLSRVRDGHIGAASLDQAGYSIQLVGVGTVLPRAVLAVVRGTPFPPQVANLVNRTAAALAVHDRLSASEGLAQELRETIPLARLAVFTQLIDGDAATARKLAQKLLPDLLNADHAQVFLLECAARQRQQVLRAADQALPRQVLMVESPAIESHIVFVAPAEQAQGNQIARQMLEAIVADYSCYLGESRPVLLERLREAHHMAAQALGVARRLPGRSAVYHGEHQLGHVLDEGAGAWSRTVLRPLSTLAAKDREDLVAIVRQALLHGHSGAARHLLINRKTVAQRCRRVEALLGVDLGDIQERARLDLALQLAEFPAKPTPSPAPCLADILRSSAARAWADDILAPLRRDSRPLVRTVRAWVACKGRVDACAQRLKAHPNTVRNHLAACEELLGRRLVGSGGGANDLVIALDILAGAEAASP